MAISEKDSNALVHGASCKRSAALWSGPGDGHAGPVNITTAAAAKCPKAAWNKLNQSTSQPRGCRDRMKLDFVKNSSRFLVFESPESGNAEARSTAVLILFAIAADSAAELDEMIS